MRSFWPPAIALSTTARRANGRLARTGRPIVLYMSMSNLHEIASAFLRAGMAVDTPATIIAAATFPGERILETRIGTASADVKAHGIGAPAVVVIGSIAALRASSSHR